VQEIEIRTADGAVLSASVVEPPSGVALEGTCVMAHALFARKSEFGGPGRPGLAAAFARRGWRCVAFDFRGHGRSKPPPNQLDWSYDDLVRFDLPAVVEGARARAEGKPVLVLGHSLGGHVALASQGAKRLGADALIVVSCNIWIRSLEPSRLRWASKWATVLAMRGMVSRFGRVPARRLRIGSDDASAQCTRDLARFVQTNTWESEDRRDNYWTGLASVQVPVVAVASEGDRWICHPDSAEQFVSRCGGRVRVIRIAEGARGRPAPGHMHVVTKSHFHDALVQALDWVATQAQCLNGRPAEPRL